MKVFLTLLVLFSWNHTYSQWLISDHTEGQGSGIGAFDAMNFGMTDLGGVSLTVDGGETFIHYDFIDADENLFDSFLPNDLEYFSPNIIYCSGQIPFVSREIVAKSIDGGSTWEFIYYEPGEGILNDLHITQAGTIFIVGSDGRVLKSEDEGLTWNRLANAGSGRLSALYAFDNYNISVGGDQGIFTTTNGGLSWRHFDTDFPINGIAYQNEEIIMAVTEGDEELYTTDSGNEWLSRESELTDIVDVAHFENDVWFVATTSALYRSNVGPDYWYLESIPEISNPLLQLEYRGGILLGNTSNGSIRSNNPSDIPTNHVRFNELIPLEPLNSEELRFSMSIDNLGSNSVNSLSIEVQIDSVFHSIVNWTGSISPRTVGQEIEVSFPTILTILDKNYQFNFTEINDETNNYSEEASQAVRFQRSLIEGTVSLGPNGDFETMEEFGLNLNTATLCGDLTILLENGVYERFTSTSQGPGLRFSQEGYKISFKAGNDIAPNVIIRGQFAITGDQSAGSALNIQSISVINNPDLKIQQAGSVFVGFGEVNLKKFDSEAPLNLMQGTALAISHCDEANVMDSNFNYGWRGLSFQGNYGSSINITQCTFQDVTLGIEMAHHIGEARIDQCSFSEVSQALDAKNTSHVSFSNNRCLELTSDHSLIHAAPSQEGQNKPFLEITNNIFENNSISTFIEMDANAFILHNIFIRNGPTNGLFPIISIQNEEAIYTQIKFNIFQLASSRIGPFMSVEALFSNPGMIDYNCYFSTQQSPFGTPDSNGEGTIYEQFEEWKDISLQDLGSVILEVDFDPNYIGNPLDNANNSTLFNVSSSSIPRDIEGNYRHQSADIGAFEVQAASIDAALIGIHSEFDCSGGVMFYAEVQNKSLQSINDVELSWSLGGIEQIQIPWTGLIQGSEIEYISLGAIDLVGEGSIEVHAEINTVNGVTEEYEVNNQISLNYSSYPGTGQLHVGFDQTYPSLENVLGMIALNGMCSDQEIIIHPGEYYPIESNFMLPANAQKFNLKITSSTANFEDVTINLGNQPLKLNGFKSIEIEHITLDSQADSLLVLNNLTDSLNIKHCNLKGSLYFLNEEVEHNDLFVSIEHNLFNGNMHNGFENSAGHRIVKFRFSENEIFHLSSLDEINLNLRNIDQFQFYNNVIHTNSDIALMIDNCLQMDISQNQFISSSQQALEILCPAYRPSVLFFENNYVFMESETSSSLILHGSGFHQSTGILNHNTIRGTDETMELKNVHLTFQNNIFKSTDSPIEISTDAYSETIANGNLYSIPGYVRPISSDDGEITLENWRQGYGQGQGSIIGEVEFFNSSYSSVDSMANGLQNQVAQSGILSIDIEGNPRDPCVPDAGCFEFGQIFIPSGLSEIEFNTQINTGNAYNGTLRLQNKGIEVISSFEYTITINSFEYVDLWSGVISPNEVLEIDIENLHPNLSSIMEASIFIHNINDAGDFYKDILVENFEIIAQKLEGIVFVGSSNDVQFHSLVELSAYIKKIGLNDNLQAIVQPGTYEAFSFRDLNLADYELEVSSLNQDATSVIISGNRAFSTYNSIGITLKHLSFENLTLPVTIDGAISPNTFENCAFIGNEASAVNVFNSNGNRFYNCSFDGILSVSLSHSTEIENCQFNSPVFLSQSQNISFNNNRLDQTRTDFTNIQAVLNIRNGVSSSQISNNIISTQHLTPLLVESCECDQIERNNVFNNILLAKDNQIGLLLQNTSNTTFAHNSIISIDSAAVVESGTTHLHFTNNIFYSENSLAFNFSNTSDSLSLTNNIFYSALSSLTNTYETIADLNVDPSLTASNNIEINPELDSIGNFITNPNALGLGIAFPTVAFDIYEEPRPQESPTCGAIENILETNVQGDFNGDGQVGAGDLLVLLSSIGCIQNCGLADLNNDGIVGVGDLLIMLGQL